jgi:hypothetical protein
MTNRTGAAHMRMLFSLDQQVNQARIKLQQTSDLHPAFKQRVQTLLRLVDQRDQALSAAHALARRDRAA